MKLDSKRQTSCDITYFKKKKRTQMNLFAKQKNLPKEIVGVEGWTGGFGTGKCTLLHGMTGQWGPAV